MAETQTALMNSSAARQCNVLLNTNFTRIMPVSSQFQNQTRQLRSHDYTDKRSAVTSDKHVNSYSIAPGHDRKFHLHVYQKQVMKHDVHMIIFPLSVHQYGLFVGVS